MTRVIVSTANRNRTGRSQYAALEQLCETAVDCSRSYLFVHRLHTSDVPEVSLTSSKINVLQFSKHRSLVENTFPVSVITRWRQYKCPKSLPNFSIEVFLPFGYLF